MAAISEAELEEFSPPSFGELLFGLLAGGVFLLFSFPIGLTHLGDSRGWSWLHAAGVAAGGVLDSFSGVTPAQQYLSFQSLWLILLKTIVVYLAALLLLSLRHLRLDLFVTGVVSLVLGTAILHVLAWLIYILFTVAAWLFMILAIVLGAVLGFLGFILGAVIRFLIPIIAAVTRFLAFLFSSAWWVVALIGLVAVVFLAVRYRMALLKTLAWLLGLCGVIAIGYLLIKLLQFLAQLLAPFFAYIFHLLAGVFQFLGMVIRFLFTAVIFLVAFFFVGFLVYAVGAWVLDLFRGAWRSGNGARGVILGSLTIGTALALVLLETNLYHLASFPFYPVPFASVAATYFHHGTPIFDLLFAILVVGVSILGVLRNLIALQKEPSLDEFQTKTVLAIGGGLLLGVLIIFVAGHTEQN